MHFFCTHVNKKINKFWINQSTSFLWNVIFFSDLIFEIIDGFNGNVFSFNAEFKPGTNVVLKSEMTNDDISFNVNININISINISSKKNSSNFQHFFFIFFSKFSSTKRLFNYVNQWFKKWKECFFFQQFSKNKNEVIDYFWITEFILSSVI